VIHKLNKRSGYKLVCYNMRFKRFYFSNVFVFISNAPLYYYTLGLLLQHRQFVGLTYLLATVWLSC